MITIKEIITSKRCGMNSGEQAWKTKCKWCKTNLGASSYKELSEMMNKHRETCTDPRYKGAYDGPYKNEKENAR